MFVAVMQVRDMGVCMNEYAVLVWMLMPYLSVPVTTSECSRVVVVTVMVVRMGVLMIMEHWLVTVTMFVVRAQHEAHTERSNDKRDDFPRRHLFCEHGPSDDRAHERRRREHHLAACCAEIPGPRDPERDRCAVPETADDECT